MEGKRSKRWGERNKEEGEEGVWGDGRQREEREMEDREKREMED